MNEFDQAASEYVGGMDSAAQDFVNQQNSEVRQSLYGALMQSPEMAARAQTLEKKTGIPSDIVGRNMKDVERQVTLNEFDKAIAENPGIAKWIKTRQNAAISYDDVENMTQIERSLRQIWGGFQSNIGSQVSGIGVSLDIGQRMLANDFASIFLPQPMKGPRNAQTQMPTIESLAGPLMGEGWRQLGGSAKDAATAVQIPGDQQTFADQVQAGLGQIVGQIASLPFTRGAGLYAQGVDVMNDKVKNDNADQRTKDLESLMGGAVTGLTEKWSLDTILGPLAVPIKNQLGAALARIGIAAAAEGVQELSENVLQDYIRQQMSAPDSKIDFGQSLGEGEIGAAVGGLVRSIVEAGLHVKTRSQRMDQRVQTSEQSLADLESMNQAVQASKVLQRNADSFEQFITEASQDHDVAHVFIDGQFLAQSGLGQELAKVSPAIAEQINEAAATGGTVAIPVAEYAARIAPTELNAQLMDNIRTEPDGFTRAEAQMYMQTQAEEDQAEFEKQAQEKELDDSFTRSAEAVRQNIESQLQATGRFTEDVNKAYSSLMGSFFKVTAAKLGVTPEQLYEQYPVQVTQGNVDGYSQVETNTEAFKKWFGDSKVVDADGKPLRVYHGTSSDFSEFDREKSGKGPSKLGFWFTDLPDFGENFGNTLMPTYVSLKNPKKLTKNQWDSIREKHGGDPAFFSALRDKYLAEGFDGVFVPGGKTMVGKFEVQEPAVYAAFHPTQIKSATGNNGNFDPNDPNILRQGADKPLGGFAPESWTIGLFKNANLSTYLHETGHFFLEAQLDLAAKIQAKEASGQQLTQGENKILADAETLLKWFKAGTLQDWFTKSIDERRDSHETFARGFESYLFEGNAPSIELQGLFQRFRAWLVRVYKELKNLNVELTDEVRSVMDRMIASTEQIKIAEQARSMMPLFENIEQSGMTPEEWQAYQEQWADPTQEAIEQFQARGLRDMKWIANARGREIKKLQKQAASLRREVRIEARKEILSQPVYQAWNALKERDGMKVSLEAFDIPSDYADKLRALKMTKTDGLHPDVAAEMLGFTSGSEMLTSLATAEDPNVAIEALTDKMMLERYGDLTDPKKIEEAADQAIHNEARAKMIATETNALARAAGKSRVMIQAAKQFAANSIARLKVRDVRPIQYRRMAEKAGKNSFEAMKKGDLETAFAEKRNQLVQTYLAKGAADAREEVASGVKYLKKFTSEGVRKGLDTAYVDQIDALLEKYDIAKTARQSDRVTSMRSWVMSQLNKGNIPPISYELLTPEERSAYIREVESRDKDGNLIYREDEEAVKLLADAIDRSAKRPYTDMTVEEFRGLVDTVKVIEHVGRLKNKLLTAKKVKEYEAVRDEIAQGIVSNAAQSGKNTRTPNDLLGKTLNSIKSFGAAHIKVATWARIMDGGVDDGPVWRYIVKPANERANWETSMKAKATQQLDSLIRPLMKGVSASDKIGKGQYFPSLKESLNWQERFAVALNIGNESNMQRLLGGKNWTFAQIKPVLDTLTSAEWEAVQAVWDHFEQYRPLIAEKELRVSGKEPEWIQARPIQVQSKDGKTIDLRGGYYPVVFDNRVNMQADQHSNAQEADMMKKAAYSVATTRRGFIKSRVDELHGRPLMLNLNGLYSGVNDVIHDLAWHEWVIDANKLLSSQTIDGVMREHYGPEVKKEFERWRDDIVVGQRRLDHAIERTAGFVRQSISASALTFNVLTAAMQPLGISNSIARVGAQWVGKGVARYVSNPIRATREAQAKSLWMENRTRTRFRELNELRNKVQGQTAAKELMGRWGYWLMMRTQLMVDVPTWWAGYEKAIAQGLDEDTAIAVADQGVKDAQGGGEEVDQAGVERGNALTKLFTTFYSYMGSTLNVAYLSGKTDSSKAKAIANIMLVTMTPAILGALMKDALVPGDKEEDNLAKRLAAEQISFLMGMFVFVREFAPLAKQVMGEPTMGYSGPAGLRVIPDSIRMVQQASQGEVDDSFVRSFINILGDLTGIPSVQINRTVKGAQAMSEGDTVNPASLVFGYEN